MKRLDEDIVLVIPGLLNNIRPSFISFVNSLPQVTNNQVYLFIPTWDIPENIVCLNNFKKEISKDIVVEPITFTYKDLNVYDYINSLNISILGRNLKVINSRGIKMLMMHFCMKQLYKNTLWNSIKKGLVIKFKNNTEPLIKKIGIRLTKYNMNFIDFFLLDDKEAFYYNTEMAFASRKKVIDKLYSDIDKGIHSYFSYHSTGNETEFLKSSKQGGDQLLVYLLKRLSIKTKPLKIPLQIGNSFSPNLIITRDKVKQVCLLQNEDKFLYNGKPKDNFRIKYLGEIR